MIGESISGRYSLPFSEEQIMEMRMIRGARLEHVTARRLLLCLLMAAFLVWKLTQAICI